jgi:hypothetical protein
VKRDGWRLGVLVAALGMAGGVGRLFDNSFFTHLATGRLIFDSGFPRVDPYTFTAAGESWFPQSWLASVLYAGVEELGGGRALRIHFGLTAAALAAVGWALTRPAGTSLRRGLAVAPFLAVGIFSWTHRPYLLAYLCLAATLLVAQRQLDRRWLLLAGWVWLNAHGSWPLGLAAAATLWIGRRLDEEDAGAERDAFTWLGLGLLLGCLNPYGPRLLTFPFVALERREIFAEITEWKAPTFDEPGQLTFLLAIAAVVVAIRLRPSWRAVVPTVAFTAAALVSVRNLHVATIVFLPIVAEGLRAEPRPLPPLLRRAAPVLGAAVAAVAVAVASQPPAVDLDIYPTAGVRFLEANDLSPTTARIVTLDFVGNWLELEYGDDASVFIDDRFELASQELVDDYLDLLDGDPSWQEVLDRYEPDAVVWSDDRPLAALLDQSDCWEVAHRDDDFVVALPENC